MADTNPIQSFRSTAATNAFVGNQFLGTTHINPVSVPLHSATLMLVKTISPLHIQKHANGCSNRPNSSDGKTFDAAPHTMACFGSKGSRAQENRF
ncbi:hypothetical protein PoMZ_10537 [Pyricularia oryzae]|uniref:Uncharacterized protein n=1 Tax=Pyricularia oryzae TaxID=318829 RepID=A0A4P7MXP2_PYROR|nr:hypothetical protein PoMZ_10537 [Pyricularia oryzae]